MTERCALCRYWLRVDPAAAPLGETIGLCRRFPPQRVSGIGSGGYPVITPSDWCGEFRAAGLERKA